MSMMMLNNGLNFSIEPLDKNVRLIVLEHNVELACRKETIQNLLKFLTINEGCLFKGRLQLNKYEDDVEVLLKGNPVGHISSKLFEQMLVEIEA